MAKKSQRWQKPKVVFQPQTYQGLQHGIDLIVDAIAPTLGPFPRVVMYDPTVGATGRLPEILDDGGTIARRIIQIAGRDADVGAMIVRHLLWHLREEVGDGTATAAVLFRAIYHAGTRYLTAGGNAMRLRSYLEAGSRVILEELSAMAQHLEGKEALGQLAYSICYDAELGRLLGEIFDIIGEYGRLELRSSNSREMEREYVEGMYWEGGLVSRSMINNQERQRAELENPAILITDLDIEDPRDLIPVLSFCIKLNLEGLVIIARKFSESAMALLLANKKQGRIKVDIVGAKTPGFTGDTQRAVLADLAVLTGGRFISQSAGESLRHITSENFGHARRVWVDMNNVGIIGGKGDPRALRKHIADMRELFRNTADPAERDKLQKRIGQLMGGSATLWVGGMTKPELEFQKELAARTTSAMRGAMREGVVPGGGVALLACRPALQQRLAQSSDVDERAAYQILLDALDAPIRTLLHNAGREPGEVMADIETAGTGYGFDVKTGKIIKMSEAGIFDAAAVVNAAVRGAVSTAALTLTTDVMVHRSDAPNAVNP